MTSPLPGWYQDPDQPTQQKWWDGREWSTYTMPLAAAESPEADNLPSGDQAGVSSGYFIPSTPSGHSGPGEAAVPGYHPAPEYPATNSPEDGLSAGAPGANSYPGYPGTAYPGSGTGTGYPGYPGTAYPGHQGYPAYPAYPGYPQIFRTNPLALTGFILGLAGFFLFFIPIFGTAICAAAVVFSVVGLFKQRDRAPRYKVFGIIGLVLGIIFTLLSLLLTIVVLSDLYYI